MQEVTKNKASHDLLQEGEQEGAGDRSHRSTFLERSEIPLAERMSHQSKRLALPQPTEKGSWGMYGQAEGAESMTRHIQHFQRLPMRMYGIHSDRADEQNRAEQWGNAEPSVFQSVPVSYDVDQSSSARPDLTVWFLTPSS